MKEQVTIDFDKLGEDIGTAFEEQKEGQPFAKRLWRKSDGHKAFAYFKPFAEDHTPVKFIGHPSRWTICSIYYLLRNNNITAHLFHAEKDLPITPFSIGIPGESQMLGFDVKTGEDYVYIHQTVPGGMESFDVFALDTVIAPELPKKKKLYIECDSPMLINGVMTLTYADRFSYMYTFQDGSWYCTVAPDTNLVGDVAEAPKL